MNHKEKGAFGEDQACDYLIKRKYCIRERNYRTRSGEIDIIAISPDRGLVFIEVKTSHTTTNPAIWVTQKKQNQIFKIAKLYTSISKISLKYMRFDVIAIKPDLTKEQGITLYHYENAFIPNVFNYF